MMLNDTDPTNVKVVGPATAGNSAITRTTERNRYLQRRDLDLAEFEELLRQARDLCEEVIIGFGMYTTPQHRNLPTIIGQQIEQIIEFKRVKQ